MAVLTVRNLPDEVHCALRVRAAEHGNSTEAEAAQADADIDAINALRDRTPAIPLTLT